MTTKQPLIGLTTRHDRSMNYGHKPVNALGEPYMKAIVQAGGVPFMIPLNLPEAALRRLFDLADGLTLTGGGDVEPSLYGCEPHSTQGDVQPDRDADEITLARWAAAENKPLLAICRGIQIISVAAGGQLWQDIPSQLPEATLHHYSYATERGSSGTNLVHEVQLTPGCRLARIIDRASLRANSLHHQAVKSVAEPLRIVGRSADGVVEVVENPHHPFYLGVQWHPEALVDISPEARLIFSAFVQACEEGVLVR
jgi:putative glutamine amidotransferase